MGHIDAALLTLLRFLVQESTEITKADYALVGP